MFRAGIVSRDAVPAPSVHSRPFTPKEALEHFTTMQTDLDKQLIDLLDARRVQEAVALAQSHGHEGDEAYKRAYSVYVEKRNSERAAQRPPHHSDEEWLRDVLSDDESPNKGRQRKRPAGHRPRTKKEPRIKWRYFPFPIAIWDDPELPANAKLAAGKIARSVNLGPWNIDLHADVSYAAFGFGSVSTAIRAVNALRAADYIRTESLNRRGVRYWFTDKASGNGHEPDRT